MVHLVCIGEGGSGTGVHEHDMQDLDDYPLATQSAASDNEGYGSGQISPTLLTPPNKQTNEQTNKRANIGTTRRLIGALCTPTSCTQTLRVTCASGTLFGKL
jgi:hypothetical protein